jgi:hypothetical protein
MKFSWRTLIILFIGFAIIEIVVKGSNIVPITSLEPLMLLMLVVSASYSGWAMVIYYLIFLVLTDLINFQVVGLPGVSFFLGYFLVTIVNRFIDIASEHKILFIMLVLIVSLTLKMLVAYLFFSIIIPFNPWNFVLNIIFLLLVYLVVNSFNTASVFKRKGLQQG